MRVLHENGLDHPASQEYATTAFPRDPFLTTQVLQRCANDHGYLIIEPDDVVVQRDPRAVRYWEFLSRQNLQITGAAIKPLAENLFLVSSLHRDASHHGAEFGTVTENMISILDCAASYLVTMAVQALDDAKSGTASERNQLFGVHYGLSEREKEIVPLVANGLQNKQIAFELSLAEHSVENSLRRIFEKVGVKNRSSLISRVMSSN